MRKSIIKPPINQQEVEDFISNNGLKYDVLCKTEGLTYKKDNDECLIALGYIWLHNYQVWIINDESIFENVKLFNFVKKIGKE